MAKKQSFVSVRVSGVESIISEIPTVIYKKLDFRPDSLKFLHLERKGNHWVLLDGLGDSGLAETLLLEFQRDGDGLTTQLGSNVIRIAVHTILYLPDQNFYHLDELHTGNWRISHTQSFLPTANRDINSILISKV